MSNTRFEKLLDIQAKALRKNGMCMRTLSVVSAGVCETICDSCADYAEQSYKTSVKLEVERAIRLLRSYGFKVEET